MSFALQSPGRHRLELKFAPSVPVRLLPTAPSPERRRHRLWELSSSLHCSIIGTCLTAADLRRVVGKVCEAPDQSDHDLHKIGVSMASKSDVAGKLLHKALDQRHESTLKRFARGKTSEDLRQLWNEHRAKGDIPGAYWAILTSALADEVLARDVFGDVHMLSHLVGAANRADIQRLSALEDENARLSGTLARQQQRLRQLSTERDHEVRHLRALLAEKPAPALSDTTDTSSQSELETFQNLTAKLQKQIAGEAAHRVRMEDALRHAQAQLRVMQKTLDDRGQLLREREAALEGLEFYVAGTADTTDGAQETSDWRGKTLLYVGGRTHSVRQMEGAAKRFGAVFLHHDGGQQEAAHLLPGLLARADIVFFPVDCISHDAALTVKRFCKQREKNYVPLPSAGLGTFVHALQGKP